ncbi:MAG: RNA pseudouridine synthase [Calditrichaeota bacterium]|nr:MAG: RNA pseudouridine synthase [Calditrichota bacterium]
MIIPLYCDNHLLFINKPAGLLSQADHTGDPDALTLSKQFIKEKYNKPGEVFLGLVHRLDRPASGVMVFARTSKAARRLFLQFNERTVDKRYLAIVHGSCPETGTCESYLLKKKEHVYIVSQREKGAQYANLSYKKLAVQKGFSLVDIKLATGRPHQIRVQMAAIGHPLLGDFRYGKPTSFDGKNLALHCYSLSLSHPTRDEKLTQVAAPNKAWDTYFERELGQLLENTG